MPADLGADGAGAVDRRWRPGPTLVTVWAAKHDDSGSEGSRAQEVGAQISLRFTIIWSSQVADVEPRDRVAFAGRDYNITRVRDLGRRKWREIHAVARAET